MKFGMNLLLWTGELHDGLLPTLEKLKDMGYDGVELPMFNLTVEKYAAWGKHLDDLGLRTHGGHGARRGRQPDQPGRFAASGGRGQQQTRARLLPGGGCHAPGGPLSLGTRILHRPGPHEGRVAVGR